MTDISPLAGLTQLVELSLDNNQISDVSPLSGLTNLRLLRLSGNPIADTSPLATLKAQNPDLEIDITLPPVEADPEPPTTAVEPPFAITLPPVEADPEPPTMVIEPPAPTLVAFADANLEGAVRETLELGPEDVLTPAAMSALLTLEVYERQIASLSGLEHATNLTALDLGRNAIVDVSPLAGLTQLEVLYLDENQIVDVSPLSGLTSLGTLFLSGNPIETLAPILHIIENLQLSDFDPKQFE